ncbi:speckle-type POZ protein B-like isoform X17 [Planococcus citri]|uniref:speckle-type POZ protein B-like isoform X17 n=1 Tax=Planococcus citri TaxID=170843 RepID=UPI0031F73CF5
MSSSFCGSGYLSNGYKTEIHSDEATCVWTITDFDFHEAKGEHLFSPPFPSVKNDQIKWYLELQPNGETDAKDSVGLYICLSKLSSFESSKKIFAKVTFHILNSENVEEAKLPFGTVKEFSHPDIDISGWGFGDFIKKDKKFRNKLLLNNTLRIRCEVKFSDMDNITSGPHQYDFGIEMPECNLSENFASLFKNQTLTDVVLSVNGKEYRAHKAVLAARSPVFCAMFTHSTKENELNRVDIEDINETVMEEMLKYIYTGKCNDLDELAEGLLAAADKYDLCQLKMMCAKTLSERLSVDNAASVLGLADMHGVKELKDKVIKFIASKPTEVLRTEGWKNIRSNFELADEVCLAIAQR